MIKIGNKKTPEIKLNLLVLIIEAARYWRIHHLMTLKKRSLKYILPNYVCIFNVKMSEMDSVYTNLDHSLLYFGYIRLAVQRTCMATKTYLTISIFK